MHNESNATSVRVLLVSNKQYLIKTLSNKIWHFKTIKLSLFSQKLRVIHAYLSD